ncbi:MAG: GAF domain-containing sensor histidine kinase, partial [Cyanothece sp. SIO1E1]|nr:GAF domain-containing sensor histidine kinase [Cyanothece sp. SIO1E1]
MSILSVIPLSLNSYALAKFAIGVISLMISSFILLAWLLEKRRNLQATHGKPLEYQGKLLTAIAQHMHGSYHLEQLFESTLTAVQQHLQVDRVVICQLRPNQNVTVVAEAVSSDWQSMLNLSFEPTPSLDWSTLYPSGKISALTDTQAIDSQPSINLFKDERIKASFVTPIFHEEQVWGLLAVHRYYGESRWRPVEINLLEQVSTQMGIAIQQAQLQQQLQEFRAGLEHQVAERTTQLQQALEFEATLKRLTDKVRDSLDERQILQTAVQELGSVLGVSSCNAALYDLERRTSTVCYEYTISGVTYWGRVLQMSNRPEIYEQLCRGKYFQFCSITPNSYRGQAATMLACPVVDNQRVLGDLWLVHEQEYAFDQSQIRLVQQVANQCAIAIRQARLYQASQAQVQELEKLNRLKDDFLSTVSHELRTPMANMKMAIHMLKCSPTDERQQRYLEILQAECRREVELINDLLDLQRLEAESYPINSKAVQLQDWLPEIVEPFRSRASQHQQTLNVECPSDLPMLTSDPVALRRILAELLNNTGKDLRFGYLFQPGLLLSLLGGWGLITLI